MSGNAVGKRDDDVADRWKWSAWEVSVEFGMSAVGASGRLFGYTEGGWYQPLWRVRCRVSDRG